MTRPTASEQIAVFVTSFEGDTLSDAQVHTVARALLDTVAVAIAGHREPASKLVLEYARQQGMAGEWAGTVWATGERLPLEMAGLVNGTMGHVLDYDDLTSPLRAHLSVAMLPLLVALAEVTGATGRQVSTAYIAGFEVACRLSLPFVSEHYARGWHSTLSVGGIGATAAGAHLLGLSKGETVNALGIAVAQASGSRENFGTMTKSFQAGQTSAVAARALALARLGFTSSGSAIDGTSGYLNLYARGEDVHESLATLGSNPLTLETCGADIKKYPLCYATHRVIDGLLDLRNEHGITLDDVVSARIRTNLHGLKPLLHHRPQTGLEAKFSMEYAVAAALADGRVALSSFEEAQVLRPEIQRFFPKVEAAEGNGPAMPRWAEITLELTDGRTLHKRVDQLRGGVELPLNDDELRDKVTDCLTFAGTPDVAGPLCDAAFNWADRPISDILATLQGVRA